MNAAQGYFLTVWCVTLGAIVFWQSRKLVREHSAWKRKHAEDVRTFEFWNARCEEALRAYKNARPEEKDAKWRACAQTMKRYEQEVLKVNNP